MYQSNLQVFNNLTENRYFLGLKCTNTWTDFYENNNKYIWWCHEQCQELPPNSEISVFAYFENWRW